MGSTGKAVVDTTWDSNADLLGGAPGTYRLFRSGDLTAPNGMIFLAAQSSEAEYYGSMDRDLDAYDLDVKNPLLIDAPTDVAAVQRAWKALHPDKELKLGPNGLVGNKWQTLDKQNSSALKKSDYDAIIYKIDGKVKEVQIPGKDRDRLKLLQTREYPSTITRKTFKDTMQGIAREYTGDSEQQLANNIVKAVSNSKYQAEYVPYMNTVVVSLKGVDGLLESRSSVYYKLVKTGNGKWFIRARGGDATD